MMTTRTKITVRVEPDTEKIGRKLAKEIYGKENKLGYVIDDAIELLYASKTNPVDASKILSVTEERLIDSIDRQVDAMGNRTVERVGNLIAKGTYETHLVSLMVEEIFRRAIGKDWKYEYQTLRREAAQKMKGQLEKEDATETATLLDDNEELRRKVNELEGQMAEARQYFKTQKEKEARVNEKNIQIVQWTNGLLQHISTASRLKSHDTVVTEFIEKYGLPEGVNHGG